MAYVNGKWETEDDFVEKRMTGLLSKDSAYMQQATTSGLQQAGKRGLLNSSMAVGAAEGARIDRALPIASQDASQTAQKNLSRQSFEQSDVLQGKQIASTEKIAGMDIASREGIAGADRASREAMLARELTSREGISAADREAHTSIATADRASRESIAGQDRAANATNVERQIAADDRRSAAGAVGDANTRLSNAITLIMNNPDIPADVRNARIEDARAQYRADVNLVEQIYNVTLDYPAPSAPPPAAPPAVQPDYSQFE